MVCPHCGKVIIVKLMKDSNVTPAEKSPAPRDSADTVDLGELLDAIDDHMLTGQAADFIAKTRQRFAKYKDRTMMSEAQMGWLRKLANPSAEEEWS